MTRWFHKCDLNWLKARQHCLTATDIKELMPITKTGRTRKVTDENYWKVYAGKVKHLTEDDCVSTGAAARGHILEPYAIDAFNKCGFKHELKHWDDVVIPNVHHCKYGLAFSPDAMDISQSCVSGRTFANVVGMTAIGEVKSYSPEHHMICGHTPKEELEERWQLATAMAVCETIETAYLMFYNPSMVEQLYVVEYSREDLQAEIDIVIDIEADWLAWIDNVKDQIDNHIAAYATGTEEQAIIDEIMKREELNPEGEKTVMR